MLNSFNTAKFHCSNYDDGYTFKMRGVSFSSAF